MLFFLFFVLSLVICIVISIKFKNIDKLEIYDVKKWSIINETVFILGVVAAIMSILLYTLDTALEIFLLFYVLLCIWHIKHIKGLNRLKREISINSVLYCKQCGTAVPKGTGFCTKCGNKIERR